jgi:hypothetical protein
MKTCVRVAMLALAAGGVWMAGCKSDQKTSTTTSSAAPAATVQSANYVNKRCPVSGEAVSGTTTTVSYQGKGVGFCCPSCVSKWNALTDAQKSEKIAAASR